MGYNLYRYIAFFFKDNACKIWPSQIFIEIGGIKNAARGQRT